MRSMPELPEVHTVATGLDRALAGARVESVRVLRRDVVKRGARSLAKLLRGRRIAAFERHGKQILWRFEPEATVRVHLGMTGNLVRAPKDARLAPHTHLRVALRDRDDEVRFVDPRRFGGLWVEGPGGAPAGRFSSALGPDALSIGAVAFREVLARDRQIKPLLLDQRAIAGLGNIYVDETLYRARVHPKTPASALDRDGCARVRRAMRAVLREAIAAGGSSVRDYRDAEGAAGWFQVKHRVYGREGEPCRRCRTPIASEVVGARTTRYCPSCQKP